MNSAGVGPDPRLDLGQLPGVGQAQGVLEGAQSLLVATDVGRHDALDSEGPGTLGWFVTGQRRCCP